MDLDNISTMELVEEIKRREGTRSLEVSKDEVHRVQAAGSDNSLSRYIKGRGPAVILEITKDR